MENGEVLYAAYNAIPNIDAVRLKERDDIDVTTERDVHLEKGPSRQRHERQNWPRVPLLRSKGEGEGECGVRKADAATRKAVDSVQFCVLVRAAVGDRGVWVTCTCLTG